LGFLKGNYLLKLVITSDFITQSKPLGGSTPQTPERISFSVGCLHAAADTFVIRVCGKKLFGGGRVWGVGCGVWGFIDFQVVNYLIFREKVQEFSPRSPQWLALFEGKKVQKSYPTRFLDLFSRP
jgi:hypothetical protein